jgi:serine/threonine-protein kinase HipA
MSENHIQQLFVYNSGAFCGMLCFDGTVYAFQYLSNYQGAPISLTMPYRLDPYIFSAFPPFFDGLLPEGNQLEGLLRIRKIDRYDFMRQLAAIGKDMVGTVTVTTTSPTEIGA